jgi:hypothetical protein
MLPAINKYAITIVLLVSVIEISSAQYHIKKTDDFELTGDGSNRTWQTTEWIQLPVTDGEDTRQAKVKGLYSATGIYFLFYNEDKLITATKTEDFDRLWTEDVNEVFLWPDTTQTVYFEYEISPLNYELPILVPNLDGKFLGWRPWEYSGDRKARHMTKVTATSWTAEFFIPYKLLAPLNNVPPRKGSSWKANYYRVDYDNKKSVDWSWRKTEKTFHEFRKFGTLIFD